MSELLRPLIEAARSGDRSAREALAGCLDRFLRLFSGILAGQARRACGSTIDFVNEGLAEALDRLEEFEYRSDEEFYAWVGRLIKSRILDALRRESRKKRAGRPGCLDDELSPPAAPGPSPSSRAASEEVAGAVRQALLELQVTHPREVEAVLLKVLEGETWEGVEQCLGLSSQKVARTLCARGLDLLRPRIEATLGSAAFEEYIAS